jgi:hypothetical protein
MGQQLLVDPRSSAVRRVQDERDREGIGDVRVGRVYSGQGGTPFVGADHVVAGVTGMCVKLWTGWRKGSWSVV